MSFLVRLDFGPGLGLSLACIYNFCRSWRRFVGLTAWFLWLKSLRLFFK